MFLKKERYIVEVIKGSRKGLIPRFLRALFWLLSWPYQWATFCRNWAYDHGWLKQYQSPVPIVVSIGNIVVGGTGKTPVTLMLGEALKDNASIGILTRGYRSPAEKLSCPVVLSAGKGPLHSAAYCGDEPYILAENLPKAYVFVGRNRQVAANMASKAGVELALLDDGMQHRRIGRDFEVVVMDSQDPFGCGHLLPRGFLRESPKALSRSDLVILNHVKDSATFTALQQVIAKYTDAPVIGTGLILQKFYDLEGNEMESIKGKKVGVICAIARPERFIETIKESGAQIVGIEAFSDHAPYYTEQVEKLANKFFSQGAEYLVCTEKDKVKIPLIPELASKILWLKMRLQVVENNEGWNQFLEAIKSGLARRIHKNM